jgi:hypothetical protein
MPDLGLDTTTSTSDGEAFEALNQLAGRRTLPIPAEILVRHILALPGPWDWPVRRAAFEALLRRLASARSQELAVIESPRRGPFGRYALGSPQAAGLLSYDVRLLSLGPIDAALRLRGLPAQLAGFVQARVGSRGSPGAQTPRMEEDDGDWASCAAGSGMGRHAGSGRSLRSTLGACAHFACKRTFEPFPPVEERPPATRRPARCRSEGAAASGGQAAEVRQGCERRSGRLRGVG